MEEIGLYIHIPFCNRKCYYCDFTSFDNRKSMVDKYMKYLLEEVKYYKDELKDYMIKTIFIGGGTPSAIDEKYIKMIMDYINKNFNINSQMEVTIEVNPGTLNLNKAKVYKESGINRISLGLQTLKDEQLESIGRIHKAKDFYNSYEILRKVGFENINADMIFGLPDQKVEDVVHDLEKVINLGLEHISYYGLIIEDGTLMAKWYEEGKLNLPSEEEERQMYYRIIEILKNNGYDHYEVSNYAKEGYQSQHNKAYWEIKPYVGLGLNSHSNFKGRRYWNYSSFGEYFNELDKERLPIEDEETIDRQTEIAEYCIFGIRFINGINKMEFKKRFNIDIENIYGDIINKHINNGLLVEEKNHIKFTRQGLDLANQVEVDFLP